MSRLPGTSGNSRPSRASKTYLQSTVSYRNPRQQEIWQMQSTHQSRLNWMHFKARMDGHHLNPTSSGHEYVEEVQVHDPGMLKEEEELRKTLEHEKKLLEEAKANVTGEINKCKKMLDEFRAQREKKVTEKRNENMARRQLYERELTQLKKTMMESGKSEINVSIQRAEGEASEISLK